MDFGLTIASLREDADLTQEQLAKSIGISRAALSHYEKSRREPDYKTLVKIANYFNVTTDYILGNSHLKRGRLVTEDELKTFIPPHVLEKRKIKALVEESELSEETKNDIIKALKKQGIIK